MIEKDVWTLTDCNGHLCKFVMYGRYAFYWEEEFENKTYVQGFVKTSRCYVPNVLPNVICVVERYPESASEQGLYIFFACETSGEEIDKVLGRVIDVGQEHEMQSGPAVLDYPIVPVEYLLGYVARTVKDDSFADYLAREKRDNSFVALGVQYARARELLVTLPIEFRETHMWYEELLERECRCYEGEAGAG